jgi:HTH-type transcriptional regulator, competence development regulator
MTHNTHRKIEFPQNRDALIQRAVAEPDGCISVGGLAQELGYLRGAPVAVAAVVTPRVFGKLIEFARRQVGWSAEQLAKEANVDLAEVVNIERERDFVPQARTVYQLANRLGYSTERLLELAGLTVTRSEPLTEAAVRFAARSEPASQLNEFEREAFEQFIKVLVESTDGG